MQYNATLPSGSTCNICSNGSSHEVSTPISSQKVAQLRPWRGMAVLPRAITGPNFGYGGSGAGATTAFLGHCRSLSHAHIRGYDVRTCIKYIVRPSKRRLLRCQSRKAPLLSGSVIQGNIGQIICPRNLARNEVDVGHYVGSAVMRQYAILWSRK